MEAAALRAAELDSFTDVTQWVYAMSCPALKTAYVDASLYFLSLK